MENDLEKILNRLEQGLENEMKGVFSYFKLLINPTFNWYLQDDTFFTRVSDKLNNDIFYLKRSKDLVPTELLEDYIYFLNYLESLKIVRILENKKTR